MQNLPFVPLQALVAVARSKNFTSAARELGVSRSAVSQSIRQLEEKLHVVLVQRTTRSVALTDAGRQLVESVAPAFAQTEAALEAIAAKPGEAVGRLRLSVPHMAIPLIVEPLLPRLRAQHPRLEVEIVVDDRLVDIVSGGFDAGVRLSESIERDMVRVRLTDAFRFVVVGTPAYFDRRGRPERSEDLLEALCELGCVSASVARRSSAPRSPRDDRGWGTNPRWERAPQDDSWSPTPFDRQGVLTLGSEQGKSRGHDHP